MRDIIEHKVSTISNIVETELMTVLKTKKEEQTVSLNEDIITNKKDDYYDRLLIY
jgi:hypothetical protein